MKKCILFLGFLVAFIPSRSQPLSGYKGIINVGEYKIVSSNLDEMTSLDLSDLWMNDDPRRRLGFIGENHQRLRMAFVSIIKNRDRTNVYLVYGKSRVMDNICPFQGELLIKESYFISSPEYPGGTGILGGEYAFYEDPNSGHAGVFKGRFVTYWYKDKSGLIHYNDLWAVADEFNNNQFGGTWSGYENPNALICNWGDARIPLAGDLDVGAGEFAVNEKYVMNGWESFDKAWRGGYTKEEMEKARKEESEKWWEK